MGEKALTLRQIVLEPHRKLILTDLALGGWRAQTNFRHEYGWKTKATAYHFKVLTRAGLIERDRQAKQGALQAFCLTALGVKTVHEFGFMKK